MAEVMQEAGRWMVPLILVLVPLYGAWKRVPIYDAFVEGAAEGFGLALRILPYLVAIMVALAALRTSGLLDGAQHLLGPLLQAGGVSADILPLVLIRPLSGNGALAVTTEILQRHGPDSPTGLLASVLQGSTDTTFYVLSLYLGSVAVHNPRYSLAVCLVGDLVAFLAGVMLWKWLLT
ncbi:MAG TPA: spore maturation protein [Firmicutes bacterium]|nr:spore maturation protein [Bacillota bacterium]